MAIMLPPSYDATKISSGEQKVFEALKCVPMDWIVIHSLGLARHTNKVYGEIDFVVICSEGVLCLEVKGGHVSRESGVWIHTDRYGNKNRNYEGPFKQVLQATHSLRKEMLKRFKNHPTLSKCLFCYGVIFPEMVFSHDDPEIIPEVVADQSTTNIEAYLIRVFEYWKNLLRAKHNMSFPTLDSNAVSQITTYLRGDFGYVPKLGVYLQKAENDLLQLTKEQANRLAMASDNPRILLQGGAGTGKTILSFEHARRQAALGKRVLFTCFNRTLAMHLAFSIPSDSSLVIKHFHGFLSDMLSGAPPEGNKDSADYFEKIMPETFASNFTNMEFEKFDTLVVDEGQDLFRLEYLICFDLLLHGGLSNGEWHMCYDPNQNIYNKSYEDGLCVLKDYNYVKLTLDTNCRNTKPIGTFITLSTGCQPVRYHKADGLAVERITFTDSRDQGHKLFKKLRNLLGQGIPPSDICILSKYKYENTCIGLVDDKIQIQNISNISPKYWKKNHVRFSTIHSFKGLESKLLLVLDIDSFFGSEAELLNYTAMTRAMVYLCIFYNEVAERDLVTSVQENAPLLNEL